MTVASQTTKIIYQGNGVAVRFAVPFAVMDNSDIHVRIVDGDVETETTDFAIDIDSQGNRTIIHPAAGAPPLPSGKSLLIYRRTPLDQEIDLVEGGPFHAEVHEDAFDKACMQIQELQEQLDRAVTIDMSDANPPTAGEILAEMQAIADEAAGSASDSSGSAAAAAQSAIDAQANVDAAVADAVARTGALADAAAQSADEAEEAARQALDVIGGAMPPPWSDTVNYAVGQITLWNDEIRQAVKASGPDAADGPVSPDDGAFWSTLKGGGGSSEPTKVNVQIFDTAGTHTFTAPYTGDYEVWVIGGGGAGGGIYTDSQYGGGGGGAGGGGVYKVVTLTKEQQVTVTVGAGGVPGSVTIAETPGGDGGPSSFGAFCSATGGKGGSTRYRTSVPAGAAIFGYGGNGGLGSGGDINLRGAPGGTAYLTYISGASPGITAGGTGGSGALFLNSGVLTVANGNGTAGAYGSGGTGGCQLGAATGSLGGAGGAGVVIVKFMRAGGGDINPYIRERFDVAGTYSWTAPHTGKYKVTCLGAGGGGGGVYTSGSGIAAAGGGASGCLLEEILYLNRGDVIPLTVGSGGAEGRYVTDSGRGGTGGSTSFGSLLTALGGVGAVGFGSPGSGYPDRIVGQGGSSTGKGSVAGRGAFFQWQNPATQAIGQVSSGNGGSSLFGAGGNVSIAYIGNSSPGQNASGNGAGGSGAACAVAGAVQPGGKGGDGLIIIESLSVYVDDVERNIYGGYVSEYRTFPGLSVAPVGWESADGGWSNNATNYGELLNWFDQHPEILKSNTDWEAMQSAHGGEGGVPFWVYDVANNRIRRPDWRGDIATQAGGSIAVNAAQRDAQQPITGSIQIGGYTEAGNINPCLVSSFTGALKNTGQQPVKYYSSTASTTVGNAGIAIDSTTVVRTAPENRPKRIGVIGCVYMGRTVAQPPVIPSTGINYEAAMETFTGNYYKGKKIYEKIISVSTLTTAVTNIPHGISNVDRRFGLSGEFTVTSDYVLPANCYVNPTNFSRVAWAPKNTSNIQIEMGSSLFPIIVSGEIVLRYTCTDR